MSSKLSPGVPSFSLDGVYRFFQCRPTRLVEALQSRLGCIVVAEGTSQGGHIATGRTFRVVEYNSCGWPALCPIEEGTWILHGGVPEETLESLAATLDCDYVFLGLYDTAGGVEYKHVRCNETIEHVSYDCEDEEVRFQSTVRPETEANDIPYGYIDSAVKQLGIIVPSFHSYFARAGRPLKPLEEIDAYYDAVTAAFVLEFQ